MTEIGRKNKCDKNTLQFPAKEEGKKNNPEHNKTKEITIQANSMVRKIQILHNLCDSL